MDGQVHAKWLNRGLSAAYNQWEELVREKRRLRNRAAPNRPNPLIFLARSVWLLRSRCFGHSQDHKACHRHKKEKAVASVLPTGRC